jgi:hypothetical protein
MPYAGTASGETGIGKLSLDRFEVLFRQYARNNCESEVLKIPPKRRKGQKRSR